MWLSSSWEQSVLRVWSDCLLAIILLSRSGLSSCWLQPLSMVLFLLVPLDWLGRGGLVMDFSSSALRWVLVLVKKSLTVCNDLTSSLRAFTSFFSASTQLSSYFSFLSSKWQNWCTFSSIISCFNSLFSRITNANCSESDEGVGTLGGYGDRVSPLQVLRSLLRIGILCQLSLKYSRLIKNIQLLIFTPTCIDPSQLSPPSFFISDQLSPCWPQPIINSFYCMSVQKQKNFSIKNPPIQSLISRHPDLLNFFASSCQPEAYPDLAVALMREAIERRLANGKHYHVEYVKHKRFLSPKQREAVSPKVTEVVPIRQSPIKIYGKPKVKIDDSEMMPELKTAPELPLSVEADPNKQSKVADPKQLVSQKPKESQLQQQKYLSPCKLPLETGQLKYPKPPVNKSKEVGQIPSKKSIESDKATLKENNSGGKLSVGSPKGGKMEKYDNVESRIKFLVDRDKHNRKIEKQLQEQSKKIGQLEERQQKLLIRQYQQLKETEHKHSPTHQQKPHLECCCQSSDSDLTNQLLRMRVSGDQYKSTVSNLQRKLESKVYKISGKPVYPMSSSSSESSSEEVVVVSRS